MKKFIIAILAIFLTACAGSMTLLSEAERITSKEYVLEAPGRSKDEIFTATKIWLAETFASAKAVTEDSDKEAGRIIGNGSIRYPCENCLYREAWMLAFTIRIDMKDGKLKVIYSNIGLSTPMYGRSGGQFKEDQPAMLLAFENLNKSLQTYVTKEKQKANW